MAYRVTETQPTPNPNAVKFVLDRPVSDRPASFLNADAARDHPLASRLFGVEGVTSVLLLNDFVTINKTPAASWPTIKRRVKDILQKEI